MLLQLNSAASPTLNCFCSRNAYDREHHHMCLVKKTIGNRMRTLASSEVLNLPNTSRVFFSEVHYSSKVRLPSNPHTNALTHALTIDAWHGCCLPVVLVLANIASHRHARPTGPIHMNRFHLWMDSVCIRNHRHGTAVRPAQILMYYWSHGKIDRSDELTRSQSAHTHLLAASVVPSLPP
jgi:hypothetical protein